MRARRDGRPRHCDPRGPGAAPGALAAAWGGLCAAAGAGPAGSGPERRVGRRVVGTGAAPSTPREGGRGRSGSPGRGRLSTRGAPARAGCTLGPVGSALPARVCAGCGRRKLGGFRAAAAPRRRGRKQRRSEAAGGGRALGSGAGGGPSLERAAWASAPDGPGQPCLFPAGSSRRVPLWRRPGGSRRLASRGTERGRRCLRERVCPAGSSRRSLLPLGGASRVGRRLLLERSVAAVPSSLRLG